MATFIGKLEVDECGIGVIAPATSNLKIDHAKITRTGVATFFTDDVNQNSLKELLSKIEALELSTESDKELQVQATELIQEQLSSPSNSEKFFATLNSIGQGTISSALGASIATFIGPYLV